MELAFGVHPKPPGTLQTQVFSSKSRSFRVMPLPSRSEQKARSTGAGVGLLVHSLRDPMKAVGNPACPSTVSSRIRLPQRARDLSWQQDSVYQPRAFGIGSFFFRKGGISLCLGHISYSPLFLKVHPWQLWDPTGNFFQCWVRQIQTHSR